MMLFKQITLRNSRSAPSLQVPNRSAGHVFKTKNSWFQPSFSYTTIKSKSNEGKLGIKVNKKSAVSIKKPKAIDLDQVYRKPETNEPEDERPLKAPNIDIPLERIIADLKEENGIDLCVIDMRSKEAWVDYLVSVTGNSVRHMRAMADRVHQTLKQRTLEIEKEKESTSDIHFNFEGQDSNEWMVIDCGRIIVQFFVEEPRKYYDTDKLWATRGLGIITPEEWEHLKEMMED